MHCQLRVRRYLLPFCVNGIDGQYGGIKLPRETNMIEPGPH